MTTLAHIADRVLNRPLLILPEKATVILEVLAGRIGVSPLVPDANRFDGTWLDGSGKFHPYKTLPGGVAVISIVGSLVNRGAWIGANSGLVSYEAIQHQLKMAIDAEEVTSIVIDIESPGGEAIGAFETAALVRQAREKKPVTAVVNGMAASAGYAIASGASEIVAVSTAVLGSIGVVLLHADFSRQLANEGVKPTLIFAGAHKVDGNPFEPLTDNVKADLQAEVGVFYEEFLKTIEAGRGKRMSAEAARATEARTFIGAQAVELGLADRIGTFETVIEETTRRASGINAQQRRMSMSDPQAPATKEAGISQADHEAAIKAARAEATETARAEIEKVVNAERDRVKGIDALAGKVPAAKLAAYRADPQMTAEKAALDFLNSPEFLSSARLTALAGDDASARAAMPAGEGEGPARAEGEDAWKAEWTGSSKLKGEFATAADYAAYKKAEAAGKFRVLKGGKAGAV